MTIQESYSALLHATIAWKTQRAMGVQHYLCRNGPPVLRDLEDRNADIKMTTDDLHVKKYVELSPKI